MERQIWDRLFQLKAQLRLARWEGRNTDAESIIRQYVELRRQVKG